MLWKFFLTNFLLLFASSLEISYTFSLPDSIQSAKSDTITATAATVHLLLGCNIILVSHKQNSRTKQNPTTLLNPYRKIQKKSHAARKYGNYARARVSFKSSSAYGKEDLFVSSTAGDWQPVHLLQERKNQPCAAAVESCCFGRRELVKKIKKGNRRMWTVFRGWRLAGWLDCRKNEIWLWMNW